MNYDYLKPKNIKKKKKPPRRLIKSEQLEELTKKRKINFHLKIYYGQKKSKRRLYNNRLFNQHFG